MFLERQPTVNRGIAYILHALKIVFGNNVKGLYKFLHNVHIMREYVMGILDSMT